MLHGRESLSRLVGKRRRTFSSPVARRLRSQDGFEYGGAQPSGWTAHESLANGGEGGASEERGHDGHGVEWVSCPVCAASVRGNDFAVNSHLDACLARGRKRKSSQCTLPQLNFLSNSREQSHMIEVDNLKLDTSEKALSENLLSSSHSSGSFLMLNSNNDTCESVEAEDLYYSESGSGTSVLEIMNEDAVKGKMTHPQFSSMFPLKVKSPMIDSCEAKDTKQLLILETFIVGRRFHENTELQHGAKIYALREPQNAKDGNAIKMFCDDNGSRSSLGYLPRELAKHLSILIDNHHLKCEGSILSLPKHPLDAVPIMLFCQKVVQNGDMNSEYLQNFESLWEKVLLANECAKEQPTSIIKYQQNFCLMLEQVTNSHSHLFTNEERQLLGSFFSLADDAQRLLIRLYTRKGPWFRLSSISYKEISDLHAAIHELQMTGYICSLSSWVELCKYNLEEVLDVLTVVELRQISNRLLSKNGRHHVRKQELLKYILSAIRIGGCPLLPKMVLELVGTCVKISPAVDVMLWRIQRLFFLNGEQDLSAFLLADIGLIKFPEYTCTVTQPIFKCRNDLLEYEEAIEVAQIIDESIDNNNMEMITHCIGVSDSGMLTNFCDEIKSSVSGTQPGFFRHFSASWIYSKVLTLGVSVYEREHRYDDAVKLLRELLKRIICGRRRGYWSLRLSVDLEHMGHVNESLSVAEKGVEDPWIRAGSKMALQRRVLRLGKPPRRWRKPSYAESVKRKIKEVVIRGRPLNNEIGAKNLFYGFDGELCGVEQLALQYYAGEGGGWQGIHSESGIWMTVFGLLMWDAIFSDVPDVFRSRFQVAPLDLLTDDFYVVRKCSIESHLQKIHEGMAEEMLITSWQLHQGTACHGINWDRYTLSDLRAAVSCTGGRCLASLCRHLAMDYKSWSSGMPDLLLWRFHGGDVDGGEAKLVEVKGPRDRLSEQQRAWMLILMDCGLETEVCKVSPSPKL